MTGLASAKPSMSRLKSFPIFDPYPLCRPFYSISGVLNEEAGKVFPLQRGGKLCEGVTDSGLARSTNRTSIFPCEIAQAEQTDVKRPCWTARPSKNHYSIRAERDLWLLIVGRIGVHSDEDMDIGSNTENLSLCLLQYPGFQPEIRSADRYTGGIHPLPGRKRPAQAGWNVSCVCSRSSQTAIHRYAIEKGHTIISNTVVDSAVGHILRRARWTPCVRWANLDAGRIDRDKMQADDSVAQDLMGSTLSGMMTQVVEENRLALGTQAYLDRMSQNYFLCLRDGCGIYGKGDTP